MGFARLVPESWWLAHLVLGPDGARVAHHIRAIVLKRIFAVILFALATKMLLSLV